MKRRTYIGSLGASLAQVSWWPFSSSEDDPTESIEHYPLEHGTDVDAPGGAHHVRPAAGAFLSEVSGAFDIQVYKEEDSWTLAAASSGTHTYSMGHNYDIAIPETFLPVAGSVLSDLRAVPRTWGTDADGNLTQIKIAWKNGTTGDETGRVEVLGFVKE